MCSQKNLRVLRYGEIPTCKADKMLYSKHSIYFLTSLESKHSIYFLTSLENTPSLVPKDSLCSFLSHPSFFLTIAVRTLAAYLEKHSLCCHWSFSLTNSSPYGFSNTQAAIILLFFLFYWRKAKAEFGLISAGSSTLLTTSSLFLFCANCSLILL